MDVNFVIITLWIVVLNDFKVRSQSLRLEGPAVAMQGSEYTLTCETNAKYVKWYKGNDYIGYSDDSYNSDDCIIEQAYRRFYKFKDCGVHKLTIKSIDYNRDNGGVWRCQNYYNQNIYNTFTIYVAYFFAIYNQSESAIHGQDFVLQCYTFNIISDVKWYRDEQELAFGSTAQYEDGCVYGSNSMYQYQFKTCGSISYLKITLVNYYSDNNVKIQCRTNSYSSNNYTLQVKVLPKFTTSTSPIVGQSFYLTCFSTYLVLWFRKTSDEKISYIGTSSVSIDGCSVQSDYKSDFEFKSCGSVYQTLTITSVDFDRDNGSTWNCRTTNGQSADSYTMIVTAPVTSVEIKSTNLNSSILSVEESQQFVIQCVTSFAYPEPIVDLYVCRGMDNNRCDTYTTNKSGKTKTSITFQVSLNSTRQLDDTRLYCSASNLQTVINSTTVTLYILHHPKIRVKADDGNLLCIAEGRPDSMTFLPWKHSIDNTLVREIEGYYIDTTVYSLNITNNQNDEGSYTCTVNNGIQDPVTKQLDQMTAYQLNLHVEPTLYNVESSNNLQVGGFSFEYLKDNTVNVSWNRDGQNFENNSRLTISEEPTEISHPYNNNIKLSGIKTTLTITSIIITDQGNYTCDICNQYGCSQRVFELNVALLKKQTNEDAVIDVNTTIIVASVVSTVILICVVVVLFIAVLRRRTKSKGSPQPIITENDLYVSSDMVEPQVQDKNVPVEMEIIENDLYISSDSLDDENAKEPPVYTQVKKTKKTETTYENNVPSMKSDNFPEYGIVQKKKGEDKTTNHDKDKVYYNTSSEAVSSVVSDFDNLEPDPYINAEYLNRKQLEIRNS